MFQNESEMWPLVERMTQINNIHDMGKKEQKPLTWLTSIFAMFTEKRVEHLKSWCSNKKWVKHLKSRCSNQSSKRIMGIKFDDVWNYEIAKLWDHWIHEKNWSHDDHIKNVSQTWSRDVQKKWVKHLKSKCSNQSSKVIRVTRFRRLTKVGKLTNRNKWKYKEHLNLSVKPNLSWWSVSATLGNLFHRNMNYS